MQAPAEPKAAPPRGPGRRLRSPIVRRLALLLAAIALGGASLVAWWWIPPAGLSAWAEGPPPRWSLWERQERLWQQDGTERSIRYEYRPLDQISIELQLAVLVGEDVNFFGHGGIDWTAVREAVDEWRAGEDLRGASTITQQLAKNLFLSNERSWLRKLREAKLAWWLERRLGKRRILELYLNVIEFDEGVLGVEAAARHYLGRSASGLDASQAAALAATIPAPLRANPRTATRGWEMRRSLILGRASGADWLRRRLQSLS